MNKNIVNRAGVSRRFGAWLNDFLIVSSLTIFVIYGAVYFDFISLDKINPLSENYNFIDDITFSILPIVIFLIIDFLYFVMFEGSSLKGTLGKIASGIRVVDKDGDYISLNRATFRYIFSLLNWLSLGAGFLLIALSKRRGLHDYICSTYVIEVGKSRFWFLHIFIWAILAISFLLSNLYSDKMVKEAMFLPANLPVIPSYTEYDNSFKNNLDIKSMVSSDSGWDLKPDYVDFGSVYIRVKPKSFKISENDYDGIYMRVSTVAMPYLNNNSLDIFYISDKDGNIYTEFLYDSVINFNDIEGYNNGSTPVIKLPDGLSYGDISLIEGKFNLRIPKQVRKVIFDKSEFIVSKIDEFYKVEISFDELSEKLSEFNLSENDILDKYRVIEFRAYDKKRSLYDRILSGVYEDNRDINVVFPVIPEKITIYYVIEYDDREYPFIFGNRK